MYLSTCCIVLSLLVLAGAQDNAPVTGKSRSSGTNVKQPAPNTQSAQPFTSGDGPMSNTPQSMDVDTPSTPATGNGAARNVPQSVNISPIPAPGNGTTLDAPQSSVPPAIKSQTDIFSSVASDQNAQQTRLSESPAVVDLAATSRPPGASALNSFSSAPLPIPSSDVPQTQLLASATPLAGLPASALQPSADPAAQLTAMPASGTPLAEQPAFTNLQTGIPTSNQSPEQPASNTLQTGIPSSIAQPTGIPSGTQPAEQPALTIQPSAIPTSNQPTEQPAVTNLQTGIPSVIPTYATQNQFTSTIPAPQSTNVPVDVVSKQTMAPTFVPRTTTLPQPSVFSSYFTSTTATQPLDTPANVQIIFNNSYSRTTASSADLITYCDGLVPSIAAAAKVPMYRITNVTAHSQPQTDYLVLRFMVQPSVIATSSVVPQSFSTNNPTLRVRRDADDTVLNNDGTVSSAVDQLRFLVLFSPQQFQLIDRNNAVLTVDRNSNDKIFVSWSDEGPCPTDPCRSPDVCVCTWTGILECQRQTRPNQTRPNLLLLLLLLLLIPFVILIVVTVVVCNRRSEQTPKEKTLKFEKRVVRADMLSYHEYIAREIDPAQPKIATISSRGTVNDGTLNTLHRSLGEHLTIAFNGSTFLDNIGISSDNADNTSRDAILPRDD